MPTIVRNRTFSFDATIYDTYVADGDPGNVPTNHTGWTIRSQIRTKVGNKLVANLNVTFPVPTAGTIAIRHERDFTRSLSNGDYWWDIVATDPQGNDHVYVEPEPILVRDHPTDPANATYDFVPGGGGAVMHKHVIADVTGLQAALNGKAPFTHTHSTSSILGLSAALAGKAPLSHTHTIPDVLGLQDALDDLAEGGVGSVEWDNIEGRPSTFAPSAHKSSHATGGSDALTPADIGAQPAGSYAPASGIAPSAITGTAVITTDSRLSDARTPTDAGLAATINAATEDTTPLDADQLPMTEAAASGALRRLTFGNLWVWVLAKITGNQPATRDALGGGAAGQSVFVAATAQAGRIALASAPVTSSGTTYSLALADNQQYLRLTSATGCVITIPTQVSVAWPDGATIAIRRATGAGALSWSAAGVTINNDAIGSIAAGQSFAIRRVSSNVWDFI